MSRKIKDLESRINKLQQLIYKYTQKYDTLSNDVRELVTEVKQKDTPDTESFLYNYRNLATLFGQKEVQVPRVPTLAGKVEAILKYLGLSVEIKPEELKPSEPVAKKVNAKKGKK